MGKFKCVNGFTKAKMINRIKRDFKGKSLSGMTCAYRGDGGKKCAAGLFIADEDYSSSMDHTTLDTDIISIVSRYPKIKRSLPLTVESMREFQTIHDGLKASTSTVEEQKQVLIDWVKKNVA